MLQFTDVENIIIGGYLYGHVGKGNQGVERVNDGQGSEERNEAGAKFVINLQKRMIYLL